MRVRDKGRGKRSPTALHKPFFGYHLVFPIYLNFRCYTRTSIHSVNLIFLRRVLMRTLASGVLHTEQSHIVLHL